MLLLVLVAKWGSLWSGVDVVVDESVDILLTLIDIIVV